jgi:TetR/AcrR family transcriptional repressor of lmrAB and yxaGH operons
MTTGIVKREGVLSMSRQRSDSRDKIIEGARTLLRRHGYQGTGLAQIIEFSGAPRGSVYFLFPGGKEEIAVAAVRVSRTSIPELIEQARIGVTVEEWLESLVGYFADQLTESEFTEGCPIATIVLDAVPWSKALTDACREVYDAWIAAILEGLVGYGAPRPVAPSLAVTLMSCLEGALVLCRARQSIEPLQQITPHLIALVGHHVPTR